MILILLASASFAADCPYGVIEKGRNGRRYCRTVGGNDKRRLAFFAGYAWCKEQGMTPTTIQSACDYDATEKWDPSNPTVCPNFANWESISTPKHAAGQRGVASIGSSNKVYRVALLTTNTDGSVAEAEVNTIGWYWCDLD